MLRTAPVARPNVTACAGGLAANSNNPGDLFLCITARVASVLQNLEVRGFESLRLSKCAVSGLHIWSNALGIRGSHSGVSGAFTLGDSGDQVLTASSFRNGKDIVTEAS